MKNEQEEFLQGKNITLKWNEVEKQWYHVPISSSPLEQPFISTNSPLKTLRLSLGLTQTEVAQQTCRQQCSISALEKRKSQIKLSTLKKIVEELGGILEIYATFKDGSKFNILGNKK